MPGMFFKARSIARSKIHKDPWSKVASIIREGTE